MSLEVVDRRGLALFPQPAVADNVGGEDGDQLPLRGAVRHLCFPARQTLSIVKEPGREAGPKARYGPSRYRSIDSGRRYDGRSSGHCQTESCPYCVHLALLQAARYRVSSTVPESRCPHPYTFFYSGTATFAAWRCNGCHSGC